MPGNWEIKDERDLVLRFLCGCGAELHLFGAIWITTCALGFFNFRFFFQFFFFKTFLLYI